MSEETSKRIRQLDSGPLEIRLSTEGGDFAKVGYALIMFDEQEEAYISHFVFEKDTPFPLPTGKPGNEACFKGIGPKYDSPESMYEWVQSEGGLGTDLDTYMTRETYHTWEP